MSQRALSMSTTVVASDRQISCDVGEEAVLLSLQDGEYYGLNPVAASIWRQVSVPRTLGVVRDSLLNEYSGITRTDCERELLSLATEMLALGIVETR